jgi:large subunit ribosomal protein L36e
MYVLLRSQRLGKRVKMVRGVVREVAGLQPYEKRVLEMLKSGASEKRMYKLCKMRLGTHRRAINKREDIKQHHADSRAAAGK